VFEPDNPGMHTTDSVDYGICLEGEMHLELDNGQEIRLTPGACVVQQGTRHAWHNRSEKPALMCSTCSSAPIAAPDRPARLAAFQLLTSSQTMLRSRHRAAGGIPRGTAARLGPPSVQSVRRPT
jgi:uncharacterized cupin superfamily protein